MEPQFRFCTSADGTRIAYATLGSGPPLLYANTHVLSINAQWRVPEARTYFEALAARTRMIIFDRRGTGASAREVDDLSPEAEAQDIATVADAAGLDTFHLLADIATAACATFAVQHPDRVLGLIFWFALSEINPDAAGRRAMAQKMREDWSYYRRLWASRLFPQGPVSMQRAISVAHRNSVTAQMAARKLELPLVDLADLLPRVSVPVLLLQRSDWSRGETSSLASLFPNARLQFVPGYPATPYPDHEAIVTAVFEFMRFGDHAAAAAASGTAIILFADIAGSTAMTERLGDAAFRAKARDLDAALRSAIRDAGGAVIDAKTLGDGVLATFPAAAQGIAAAQRCAHAGEDAGLPMHLGLHAGDVIREENNVFGGAVNIASRICGLCAPGEILVSQTVRDLARTSAGVTFEDRGEQVLKGIEDPVRVFAVRPAVGS